MSRTQRGRASSGLAIPEFIVVPGSQDVSDYIRRRDIAQGRSSYTTKLEVRGWRNNSNEPESQSANTGVIGEIENVLTSKVYMRCETPQERSFDRGPSPIDSSMQVSSLSLADDCGDRTNDEEIEILTRVRQRKRHYVDDGESEDHSQEEDSDNSVTGKMFHRMLKYRQDLDNQHGHRFAYPIDVPAALRSLGIKRGKRAIREESAQRINELYRGANKSQLSTLSPLSSRTNIFEALGLQRNTKFVIPRRIYGRLREFMNDDIFLRATVTCTERSRSTAGQGADKKEDAIEIDDLLESYFKFPVIRPMTGAMRLLCSNPVDDEIENVDPALNAARDENNKADTTDSPVSKVHGVLEMSNNELSDGCYVIGQYMDEAKQPVLIKCDIDSLTMPDEIDVLECRSYMWDNGAFASGLCRYTCDVDCNRHPIRVSCIRENLNPKQSQQKLELQTLIPNVISVPVTTGLLKQKPDSRPSKFQNDGRVILESVVELTVADAFDASRIADQSKLRWDIFRLRL